LLEAGGEECVGLLDPGVHVIAIVEVFELPRRER
jgi:hypothetical protein